LRAQPQADAIEKALLPATAFEIMRAFYNCHNPVIDNKRDSKDNGRLI